MKQTPYLKSPSYLFNFIMGSSIIHSFITNHQIINVINSLFLSSSLTFYNFRKIPLKNYFFAKLLFLDDLVIEKNIRYLVCKKNQSMYRVYRGFRLNLGERSDMNFLFIFDHFWSKQYFRGSRKKLAWSIKLRQSNLSWNTRYKQRGLIGANVCNSETSRSWQLWGLCILQNHTDKKRKRIIM